MLKEVIRGIGLINWHSSGQGQMLAAYGHANKPPGFTKSGVFLNYLLSVFQKWRCSMETVILKVTTF
jgi:hypothetical protein